MSLSGLRAPATQAVDRRRVHVGAIEGLAQLQLNAHRSPQETRQGS